MYFPRKTKGEKTQLERLNSARADKTELEVRIKSGEYVPLSEVRDVWTTLIGRLKSRLDLLPQTLCGQVSLETEPARNRETIAAKINEALHELSQLNFESLNIPEREETSQVVEGEDHYKAKSIEEEPEEPAHEVEKEQKIETAPKATEIQEQIKKKRGRPPKSGAAKSEADPIKDPFKKVKK